jgi:hypothetical protein
VNSRFPFTENLTLKGPSLKKTRRMQKKALITGITGQDGAYLAEFLIKRATLFMASNAGLP